MNLLKKLICSLLFVVCLAASASAWDAGSEILRLKKEVPSFETLEGGSGAVIWQRITEMKLLPDGTQETLRCEIIMIGEQVPEAVKRHYFPVPAGGSVQVLEAGWYNPMNGMKEGNAATKKLVYKDGAEAYVIETPDEAVGRAFVFAVAERTAAAHGLDRTIPTADVFPVWEQIIIASVPKDMKLFYDARDVKEPEQFLSEAGNVFKWQIMNQLPWNGEGFVVNERPIISVSSRERVVDAMTSLEKKGEAYSEIPVPQEARGMGAEKLIAWVNSRERTLPDVSDSWMRDVKNIPASGPWTQWEKTFLLKNWLTKMGFNVKLCFEAKIKLHEDAIGAETLFSYPLLNIKQSGNGHASMFRAGLPFSFGKTPSAISGIEAYALSNGKFKSKKLPQSAAGINRLTLLWLLKLNENGHAEGTLDFSATGGWAEQGVPTVQEVTDHLLANVNFALPGMSVLPKSVKEIPGGYRVLFGVKCMPGLIYGKSLLLRLPGGVPLRLSQMVTKEKHYTLRFPFVIDQKVRMDMPGGYKLIQEPPLKKIGEGTKMILTESITHWPKKADLLADSIWTVRVREIDEKFAPLMREELSAILRWPVLNLPFRKVK